MLSVLTPAQLELRPPKVEVGEPFTLSLVLDDPTALDPGRPVLDDSWVLFDEDRAPAGDGLRYSWRIASLEAGERLLGFEAGADSPSAPDPVPVTVVGLLAAEETGPRPVRGLPEDFGGALAPPTARSLWRWGWAGLGALLLAALVAWGWRRRRRVQESVGPPSPLERFESARDSELESVARHHLWAQLLREATDTHLGEARAAWCEEEWLVAVAADERLATEVRRGLSAALTACGRVRFAGEVSSSFAREELEREVHGLLLKLARSPVRQDAAGPGSRRVA